VGVHQPKPTASNEDEGNDMEASGMSGVLVRRLRKSHATRHVVDGSCKGPAQFVPWRRLGDIEGVHDVGAKEVWGFVRRTHGQ
jgi:hypothetical protein